MNCRTAAPCILHPTSALYGLGYMPDYVIYHELVMTSKQYMMCVTSVDPYWLGTSLSPLLTADGREATRSLNSLSCLPTPGTAELGSVFFSVREKNFDGRERSAVAKEFSKKAELEMEMAKNRETCVVLS